MVCGGVFRVSVPDHHSPFLLKRCVFNHREEILLDASTDSNIGFDVLTGTPTFKPDAFGNSHLWFPTHIKLMELIEKSDFRNPSKVVLYHGYLTEDVFVTENIPDEIMPVRRSPPGDMRSNGKPICLVLDIIKNT